MRTPIRVEVLKGMTACIVVSADDAPSLPRIAAVRGAWQPVGVRTYGAGIYRVGDCYVKIAPASWGPDDLRLSPPGEAARLAWLGGQGLPVPDVVDVGGDDDWTWLVTQACPGVPVTHAPDPDVAVDAFADVARTLHQLASQSCPFGLNLETLREWARRATSNGWVDTADLDPGNAGRSPGQLLAELEAMPQPDDIDTVTHGDLTPDNVLVDPATGSVTAVLDAGRLGVTGVWRDLAVARRNLVELDPRLPERFLTRHGTRPDPAREAFYRLLDEFL